MPDDAIHILLIEDSPGDAEICREGLLDEAPHGSTVVTATTLDDGLALLEAGSFDLVVSDLLLPDSGAARTLRALRAACRPGSVVVVTGLDDEQVSLQALRDGAAEVLFKSELSGRSLRRSMRRALERTRSRALDHAHHRAEKLEAVTRLSAGIAHHFNNLLTIILGNAELIRGTFSAGSETAREATEISCAADRAALLTKHLLQFCCSGAYVPDTLDVNAALRSLEPMLRDVLGENVELVLSLSDQNAIVRTDRICFEQSVLTVALNGRDAMRGRGRLTVSTRVAPGTVGRVRGATAEEPFVVVTVTDEGSGVPASVTPHLFEPFFTTKDVGQGSGMGLAAVHGTVQRAGGHVALVTKPGRGTSLSICLPALREGPGGARCTS